MIFQLGKTRLRLSFSFVALVELMILLCDENTVLCSLVSSVTHELGHLFFMFISRDVPRSIELTLFGMRIDRNESACVSYGKEILISLGGIIFNILSALICFLFFMNTGSEMLLVLSAVNFIVAGVNSFPVTVLDCGRAIRYALRIKGHKSDRIADIISVLFLLIFVGITIIYSVIYGINISLIALNIYLIIITIIKKWS